MRLTILHAFMAVFCLAVPASAARAQPPAPDPFAAHAWHFETDAAVAFEAWNYNGSHEDLFGLNQTVTYGIRNGFVFRAGEHLAYVSQRGQDGVILGLTMGVRRRIAQRGRVSAFLQGDLGVSATAVAAPPRGTRFNYLAIGGGGVMVRLHPRLHFVTTLQLIHVSNASVKGPGRNPDIEAIGPSLGLLFKL